jgi:hypothetical protein
MTKILSRLGRALLPSIKNAAKDKLLDLLDDEFVRNVATRANAKIDFPYAMNEVMEQAIIEQVVELVVEEAEGLIRKL